MIDILVGLIQSGTGILAVVVATVAIVISICVERRNHKRFQEQIEESKHIAEINVKPFLWVYPLNYLNRKAINLMNSGLGTAIITVFELKRGDKTSDTLEELFEFHEPIVWNTSWRFKESRFYLPPGHEKILVEITSANLENQKFGVGDINKIMETWDNQLLEIKIRFEYTDIFGNPQPECLYPDKKS